MQALDTIKSEFRGHKIEISIHEDTDMGPPWQEHDGHGEVTNWENRDKRPGELILHTDGRSKRFYDYAATMIIAKRDGWGISEKAQKSFAAKHGRQPTKGEVCHLSVMADFEHLKGWCNDEWQWLGYTTEIITPNGERIDGDSCWGFEDQKYMVEEAQGQADWKIKEMLKVSELTQIAECVP